MILLQLFLIFLLSILLLKTISKSAGNLHGPPSLPVIGHLYLLKKPLHLTLLRLSERYGPIIFLRFGYRHAVVVSSLSLAHDCFTKLDAAIAGRPHFPSAERLTYRYKTIGTVEYGPHWRKLRGITTHELFSSLQVQSTAEFREKEVHALLRGLHRQWKSSLDNDQNFQFVELNTRIYGLVLNLIMINMVGKRYYGEEGIDAKAKWFMEMVESTLSVIGVSNLQDFFPVMKYFDFHGVGKKMSSLEKKWDDYLQGLIEEYRNKIDRGDRISEYHGRKKTMIEILVSLQREDPEYYNDQIIKALVIGLFLAGTDTSAATLEWAISLLLNNPDAMEKARLEIEAQVGENRLVREEDLPSLPYLNNIINETLRLYPPAPLLLPHETIKDCELGNGLKIQQGTMVLINAYAIQRDPHIWKDAIEFKPERFDEIIEDKRRMLLPFGMGRRRCPAEGLSYRLAALVLGTLVQCFELKRVGKEKVDMSEGAGLTMRKLMPLEAMYRPRVAMVDLLSEI